jgi:hypothetical protein
MNCIRGAPGSNKVAVVVVGLLPPWQDPARMAIPTAPRHPSVFNDLDVCITGEVLAFSRSLAGNIY